MKKIKQFISFVFLLFVFCLGSCDKAGIVRDKQIIERIKNSPRDTRLIGKWKVGNTNKESENIFAINFREDAVVERAFPVYDKNNKIAYFKRDKVEIYFYTENDSVLNYYTIHYDLFHGSYNSSGYYKINKDTLYLYNSNEQSTGIRDNTIIIQD